MGHPPFEGERSEVLQKQLHESLPLKQIKNPGLRKIVSKATEKSRAKRYQSASEFRVDLDRLNSATQQTDVVWKNILTYLLGGVAVCAIVVGVVLLLEIFKHSKDSDQVTPTVETAETVTYASATSLLHNQDTFGKGLKQLDSLSEAGEAKASYLLSRLFFKSLKEGEVCPDSIIAFQAIGAVRIDNEKAHELVKRAVKQDSTFYQAIYELASDSLGGPNRTEAVEYTNGYPDFDVCHKLFVRALKEAQKANDKDYIKKIKAQMESYVNIRFTGYKGNVIRYEL